MAAHKRDLGTRRVIPPRYPLADSGLGGTCAQCRAKYPVTGDLEQAGFQKHRRQKHVSRVKGSIDILLNTSCRLYTPSAALLFPLSCICFFALLSRSLISLCAHSSSLVPFWCPSFARSADPLPGRGQPTSPSASALQCFLALQSRHGAFAGVKSSMTVPVAIVRYGWLC